MLKVERFVFSSFATNMYVVSSLPTSEDERGFVLLIDPSCSNSYEQQQLSAYVSSLQAQMPQARVRIIATHGHLDHLWGAAWACARWQTAVLLHKADIAMAEGMQTQYELFGIYAHPASFPIEPLEEQLSFCGAQVLHTPGHTGGSICLYWKEERVLLSGDTLFRMGYGRTDLPGGNTGQLIRSLQRLSELPADVHVYPGHGESTTIGEERR